MNATHLHYTEQANLKISSLVSCVETESCWTAITRKDPHIGTLTCLAYLDSKGTERAHPPDRLVTANGPIKLSEGLTKQVVQGMQMARTIEKQMQAEGQQ